MDVFFNIILTKMPESQKFKSKEDESVEILIKKSDILEIVPDAIATFSLIILKDGSKHFVYGTQQEIYASFS